MPETEYIRKDVFDIHVKNLRERDDSDERVADIRFEHMARMMDDRFDRMQNLIEESVAVLGERIDRVEQNVNRRMDRLEKKVDDLGQDVDNLRDEVSDIRGDVKANSARLDALQIRFGWQLTLLGVLVAAVIAIVQRLWR